MSTTTLVRVISMTTATARRAAFAAAADTAMAWSFFDARRSPESPAAYDDRLALRRFGRPLKPGEIGCYASHFAVWRQFLDSGADQLVVLEDDVFVDWPAVEQLCRHDLAGHGIHVLKLFATHPLRSRMAKYKLLSDHSHLLRLFGHAFGTQAYVLTRRGAAALVLTCPQMTMPVDWAMSRYWAYGLPSYAVFPFPVIERHGPSTIEHAQQVDMSTHLRDRTARLAWRIGERVSRVAFDLTARENPAFGRPEDAGAAYLGAAPGGH
ncbi:glycosyltransferase family 25 protein [Methylibium sp. Pch-M]|uniref:glycosyltransferase family 25 protein n=1 Tax=Methylibium sp. Pch-M TaxID=2082386 RepID=UPI0013EABDB3|nr:glycosyltransferase family 25 protein [Methylibium sp. Pch-M]